jgi:ABC-type amino acid transport substrate-binding protein
MTSPGVAAALVIASLACSALACAELARAEPPLTVCLDRAAAAGSDPELRNFDLDVAKDVGRRIGREIAVQWFESSLDGDHNPDREMNALLSDGRCQLVPGYPLTTGVIGPPNAERSTLPDFDGKKPGDRRRLVQLSDLIASRGYRFDPFVVVRGPRMADHAINSLADLKDANLVVEQQTLADLILMAYHGGILVNRITHIRPGPAVFDDLERGEHDASLVELHRLDQYLVRHPNSGLSSSGHYHSIGFNWGMIGRADDAPLMERVNAALGEMLTDGTLPILGKAEGLTYVPPRQPEVLTTIKREAFAGD